MSKAVVKLNWDEATHEEGIKSYGVYVNGVIYDRTTDLKYNLVNIDKPKEYLFFIVAETNSKEYLKSNIVTLKTVDGVGYQSFNYTLNFSL